MLSLRYVLISFNLEKNHSAVALSHVMSETIAGQCTEGGCYGVNFDLLQYNSQSIYVIRPENPTLWLCLCVRVRACVFCGRTHFFPRRVGGGPFNMSRPRGPWFLNPSMRMRSEEPR